MLADAPRAQRIHIETDRRLGHEWDEWDGKPLPGNGDFSSPPGLFFRLAALTLAVGLGAIGALIFLLAPRLAAVLPALPALLWGALAVAAGAGALWFALLLLSFYGGVLLLPEGLLERGPYLPVISLTSYLSRLLGRRDWAEHAAIDVYNALAERRRRPVGKGARLGLIPRCLPEQALGGGFGMAGRLQGPGFRGV